MKLRNKDKEFLKVSAEDVANYNKTDMAYIEYSKRKYKPQYIDTLAGFLKVRLKGEPDKALYLFENMDILSSAYRLGLSDGLAQNDVAKLNETIDNQNEIISAEIGALADKLNDINIALQQIAIALNKMNK